MTASANNPVPTITQLNPNSLAVGAAPQTLTINGTGLLPSSTVTFNGVSHAATFIGATQITIMLTTSDLATAGNYPIVVTNSAPGGGASTAVNFFVTSGQGAGEWAWMGGSETCNGNNPGLEGVYGTLGTPAVGNIPGGRVNAASWNENGGDFWLFAGTGWDGGSHKYLSALNDLWRFDLSTNEWAWMSGSSGAFQSRSLRNIGDSSCWKCAGRA